MIRTQKYSELCISLRRERSSRDTSARSRIDSELRAIEFDVTKYRDEQYRNRVSSCAYSSHLNLLMTTTAHVHCRMAGETSSNLASREEWK
jgi:hypothetical protein